MNIATLLSLNAEMMPAASALSADRDWSYGELRDAAARFSGWLAANGYQPGDVVVTIQEISGAHVAGMFGAWAAGLQVTPLNFRLRAAEIRQSVLASDAALVISDERYRQAASEALDGLTDAPRLVSTAFVTELMSGAGASGPARLDVTELEERAAAIVLLTSGTTGQPKPVTLRHGDLFLDVVGRMEPPDGVPRGKALLAVPSYHVAGLGQLLSSIYTGRPLVAMTQFDPDLWLAEVTRQRIQYAFVVPTMLNRILSSARFGQADLSSLALISYGAAPASPALVEQAIRLLPATCDLANAYGQTETRGTVTILDPDDHRRTRDGPGRERALARLASVGRAVPGVELQIWLDGDAARPAASGETGEVAVRRTGEVSFRPTGDLGYLDDEGYLFLAGRAVDRIIRGGENIDPVEIEHVLDQFPGIAESAIVGAPDDDWGEVLVGFVVSSGDEKPDAGQLRSFVRQRLASYKVPDRFVVMDSLPRNALGKIQRNLLRERL
jgi:acyl-CoA synthetase (AMP-forming)/AMP-acid ligase II